MPEKESLSEQERRELPDAIQKSDDMEKMFARVQSFLDENEPGRALDILKRIHNEATADSAQFYKLVDKALIQQLDGYETGGSGSGPDGPFLKRIKAAGKLFHAFRFLSVLLKAGPALNLNRGIADEIKLISVQGKIVHALQIKPDSHSLYYEWGIILQHFAEKKAGVVAEALYEAAIDRFEKAITCESDISAVYYNLAEVLSDSAELKKNEEADVLYKRACDAYAELSKLNSLKKYVYYPWGCTLLQWAGIKRG